MINGIFNLSGLVLNITIIQTLTHFHVPIHCKYYDVRIHKIYDQISKPIFKLKYFGYKLRDILTRLNHEILFLTK